MGRSFAIIFLSFLFIVPSVKAQEWIDNAEYGLTLSVNEKGLYGYHSYNYGIDLKDSPVKIPHQYEWATIFDENAHAVVKIKNKIGLIDTLGRFVVPADYDYVFPFANGMAVVYLNEKFGAVDVSGKLIIPLEYQYITSFKAGGRTDAVINNRWGVIDTKNKIILPFEYIYTNTDDKNYTQIYKEDWGYLNPVGEKVFDSSIQMISHLPNDIIELHDRQLKSIIVDKSGNPLLPSDYQFSQINEKGTHIIVKKDNKYGLYHLQKKELTIPIEHEDLAFVNNFVQVKHSVDIGPQWFEDLDGKLIGEKYDQVKPIYEFSNFAAVRRGEKWGLMDSNGKLILPIQMGNKDESSIDVASNRIVAMKRNMWGMTDYQGNSILPYQYRSALDGMNNPFYFIGDVKLNVVKDNVTNKKGVVNQYGEWIIHPDNTQFDDIGVIINTFSENKGVNIPISKNGKWGVYNIATKKEIITPQIPQFTSSEYDYVNFLDNDKWGIMLFSGKRFNPDMIEFLEYDRETQLMIVKKNDLVGLMNLEGKLVAPYEYETLNYDREANLYFAVKNSFAGFITPQGKTHIPFIYQPLPMNYPNSWYDGHVNMILKGKNVMLNSEGKTVVSYSDFNAPVDARISIKRYSGLIYCFTSEFADNDIKDQNIILNKKIYNHLGGDIMNVNGGILKLDEGLLTAKRDGLFGYLDQQGNEVIPFQYQRAGSFKDGIAYVKKDGKFFIINRHGKRLTHIDMQLGLIARFDKSN